MISEDIQKAIALAKSGNKSEAKILFEKIVAQDPKIEIGWLWLTACVETDDEKLYYLHKVLEVNPNNITAQKAIEKLTPIEQPNLEQIVSKPDHGSSTQKPNERTPGKKGNNKQSRIMLSIIGIVIIFSCLGIIVILSLVGRDLLAGLQLSSSSGAGPTEQMMVVTQQEIILPPTFTPAPTPSYKELIIGEWFCAHVMNPTTWAFYNGGTKLYLTNNPILTSPLLNYSFVDDHTIKIENFLHPVLIGFYEPEDRLFTVNIQGNTLMVRNADGNIDTIKYDCTRK